MDDPAATTDTSSPLAMSPELIGKGLLCARSRRVCKAANVRDLHLHDPGAEFASQLAESNVSVEQVRDALGPSNISMTNTYSRSHRKALRRAYQQRRTHRALRP